MSKKCRIFALLAIMLCFYLTGCQVNRSAEADRVKVTLNIKTPPIGLGNVPDVGEAEVYDMLTEAAQRFQEQYEKYDVEFVIIRYDYMDEQEQLAEKYGTKEAADIFFSGSYNTPLYAKRGWLVELDDIISEELRADIDESIWGQSSIDGKVYILPFHQLQNTLMVNRDMMEEAGLQEYIPEGDSMAHWSTGDLTKSARS